MKKLFTIALLAAGIMSGLNATAQKDKSQRPSPPAKVTQELKSGASVSIDYSQPSLKGREIGKDVEPMEGQVWRTGANEATVFETNTDITVMGKHLPAGKYSLFTIYNGKEATVIFNKKWDQWGSENYNIAEDQLRIQTKVINNPTLSEKMTFEITPEGQVLLDWGKKRVMFMIQ